MRHLAWVSVAIFSSCTAGNPGDPPPGGSADGVAGIAGDMLHRSDEGGPDTPEVGKAVFVFPSDHPGLSAPLPPELEEVRDAFEGDLGSDELFAAHPESLGSPTARTVTDAEGRFSIDVPPGDYVLGQEGSPRYARVTVRDKKRTRCDFRWGYRYAQWRCESSRR